MHTRVTTSVLTSLAKTSFAYFGPPKRPCHYGQLTLRRGSQIRIFWNMNFTDWKVEAVPLEANAVTVEQIRAGEIRASDEFYASLKDSTITVSQLQASEITAESLQSHYILGGER